MAERPTKRLRGSYAKLICLRCRERRIKCQIPDGIEVDLSGKPQPPDQACERCRQRGLDCVLRKTTLGRPAQKPKAATSTNGVRDESAEGVSPHSPEPSDLVLLAFEHDDGSARRPRQPASGSSHNNARLIRAIARYFDLTSGLLARDPRFGGAIVQATATPRPLESLLNAELAQVLDQHLIWLRLYMPWLPRLDTLQHDLAQSKTSSPTRLLAALLALIALDMPSTRITAEQRLMRGDLQAIIKTTGREVLLTLPRHRHTADALLLVHEYRPLSLIESHEAAVQTLNGMLYPTLIYAVQQQLGMDLAVTRLRHCLDQKDTLGDIHQLILDTIQWCLSKSLQFEEDVFQGDVDDIRDDCSEREIESAFGFVSTAIDRGLVTITHLFAYFLARCQTDERVTFRRLTKCWSDLTLLASVIQDHEELCNTRKVSLENIVETHFCAHGKTEEALAVLQILNMEINHVRTNVLGLAMFFAIVSVAQDSIHTNPKGEVMELSKHYSSAVHEIQKLTFEKSDVWMFLERYGDIHMDGLERKLSDFISLANEVQLDGVAFLGPPRHTTFNVLLTCKEIVENNAVRIRLDGEIHPRVDMQLILFQEAARRLECMEVDGGSAEAIARGSMFTAAAKLIRSLHRILSQWKRSQLIKQPAVSASASSAVRVQVPTPAGSDSTHLPTSETFMEPSGLFPDDFFADWDNWPQLNAAELAYSFPFDYDLDEQ